MNAESSDTHQPGHNPGDRRAGHDSARSELTGVERRFAGNFRLTRDQAFAQGELYSQALLVCQTAPDLETLKSGRQRRAERGEAAEDLWKVVDEQATHNERVTERAKRGASTW